MFSNKTAGKTLLRGRILRFKSTNNLNIQHLRCTISHIFPREFCRTDHLELNKKITLLEINYRNK